ncbi:MAG: 6-carboxytetrahydropterin synthase QueD [Treponema sp.]|nr:6-carboxytetrahydropterin synthase QueD [Treponema sp.]
MSCYEVRVEAMFSAAHFLRDYRGKCEQLHGHNYTVRAHVRGVSLAAGGMLFDFAELKRALKTVCAALDHTNLNDLPIFDDNPSAERIAHYIYDALVRELKETYQHDVSYTAARAENGEAYVAAIDVFETDTSRARYCVI